MIQTIRGLSACVHNELVQVNCSTRCTFQNTFHICLFFATHSLVSFSPLLQLLLPSRLLGQWLHAKTDYISMSSAEDRIQIGPHPLWLAGKSMVPASSQPLSSLRLIEPSPRFVYTAPSPNVCIKTNPGKAFFLADTLSCSSSKVPASTVGSFTARFLGLSSISRARNIEPIRTKNYVFANTFHHQQHGTFNSFLQPVFFLYRLDPMS